MDERSTDQPANQSNGGPRRGHRVVTALLVAGVLAAVPVGVALAGGSDGSAPDDGSSSGAGAVPAQSTTPEEGQRDRGQGDRGDCPEKDGQGGQESDGQGGQESALL
jgi:hypothetical protein